jgi:antitoxin ParD1/3/4
MPTRNVVLTDHQDTLIADWITAGRYQNASEVLREGLRLTAARFFTTRAKSTATKPAAVIHYLSRLQCARSPPTHSARAHMRDQS